MKKTLLAIACASALGAQAATLNLGLDLSGSNPLLAHPNFAASAADRAAEEIRKLENGDILNIRSFGARDNTDNLLNNRFVISRHNRADALAKKVAQYIRSLPERNVQAQDQTNLIAYLEFSELNCDTGGRVLAITDGLESSSELSGYAFKSMEKGLPAPEVSLAGCHITFYGLGAGWEPRTIRHVRREWQNWMQEAEADFVAIIP